MRRIAPLLLAALLGLATVAAAAPAASSEGEVTVRAERQSGGSSPAWLTAGHTGSPEWSSFRFSASRDTALKIGLLRIHAGEISGRGSGVIGVARVGNEAGLGVVQGRSQEETPLLRLYVTWKGLGGTGGQSVSTVDLGDAGSQPITWRWVDDATVGEGERVVLLLGVPGAGADLQIPPGLRTVEDLQARFPEAIVAFMETADLSTLNETYDPTNGTISDTGIRRIRK